MTMAPRLILPARDSDEGYRASTPLELLFDLVIVIAIAALTAAFHHALADGHGAEALPRFLLLFITIWWAWMGVTWFASAFGHEDAVYKLLLGVIMTGALIYAAGAGSFFDTMDLSWGLLGWSIMRLALAVLWLRVARQPAHRSVALRFMGGILVAQIPGSCCISPPSRHRVRHSSERCCALPLNLLFQPGRKPVACCPGIGAT
ncbi:MAG: low temperature requirement protein A [Rhizobiaceae bacterium]